jgi:hypothetical protein
MRTSSIVVLATVGLIAVGCASAQPPAPYGSGGDMSAPTSAGPGVVKAAPAISNAGAMQPPTQATNGGINGQNNVGPSQGSMQPPAPSGPGIVSKP